MLTEAVLIAAFSVLNSINNVIAEIVKKASPENVNALLDIHIKHRLAVEGFLDKLMTKIEGK